MGMSTGDGGGGGAMADINVTPLVDVMLVLLIIFMITAPMLNQGVDIDLPNEQAAALTMPDDQIILRIDKNLVYSIKDSKFDAAEMPAKLAALAKANPGAPVFLEADGSVPYREVAFLLAATKRAGIPRVGMVFDPAVEEEPR